MVFSNQARSEALFYYFPSRRSDLGQVYRARNDLHPNCRDRDASEPVKVAECKIHSQILSVWRDKTLSSDRHLQLLSAYRSAFPSLQCLLPPNRNRQSSARKSARYASCTTELCTPTFRSGRAGTLIGCFPRAQSNTAPTFYPCRKATLR